MDQAVGRFDTLGKSTSQVQTILQDFHRAHPDQGLLLGHGWLFDTLVERPHRRILDEVEPDIPVFIDSANVHSCWLNSAALKAIGVDDVGNTNLTSYILIELIF